MALMEGVGKKVAIGLGLAGVAAAGFTKGMKSTNVSAHAYNTLFNDPVYDQEVLGTHVGIRELLAPYKGFGSSMTRLGAIRQGGVAGFATAAQEGFVNRTSVSDYMRTRNTYANSMPSVDGSIVFGMYNASQGG